MYRAMVFSAVLAAASALMAMPALAGGHGCCCGTGGYVYYDSGATAAPGMATAPTGRVYSYQPGTAEVVAPASGFRSYSYAPGAGYSFGVRSAASKSTFNYAPHRGR